MIIGLMGNETAEKVLLFLANYGEGYAKGISENFEISLSQVQRQLIKFEREGVLVSKTVGKTRVFLFNPRYAFKKELLSLLNKALEIIPRDIQRNIIEKEQDQGERVSHYE